MELKLTYKIVIISFFIIISAKHSFGQLPRLHIDGKNIYDQNDSLVILRGFNHSRWGEVQAEDASIIKNKLGGNMMRTCLRWHYWGNLDSSNVVNARESGAPGHIKPDYLEKLDSTISWNAQAGIWTILFVNSDQGSGANEKHFLNTPALEKEFIELWLFLANRYKDTPYIGAFEILAEPRFEKYKRSVTHAELTQFYKKMADTISTVTKGEIPYVIGPMNHYKAANLTNDYYLDGYQIIYAANMLWPKQYVKGNAPYGYPSNKLNHDILETYYTTPLEFREINNVPVWVDQFGASFLADGYLDYNCEIIEYFESKNLHWSYWNFRNPNGNRGIFERIPARTSEYQLDTALFNMFNKILKGKD